MIENYLNDDARDFLASFPSDADREWCWQVIEIIRKRFPLADHWTTRDNRVSSTNIKFGKRPKDAHNGACVIFRIRCPRSGPFLELSKTIKERFNLDRNIGASRSTHPGADDINTWLDAQIPSIKPELAMPTGNAYVPSDYQPAEDDTDDRDDVDEPEILQPLPTSKPLDVPLNTILYGPPGTGKTYATIDAALAILDPAFVVACKAMPVGGKSEHKSRRVWLKKRFDDLATEGRIRFVTFHQSFSYEDFVEGLRAVTDDNLVDSSGGLKYRVEPGVFLQICLDARSFLEAGQTPQAASPVSSLPYVLIIDEINRGNVSRIFGELITLIEPSKRAGAAEALAVTLPYSKERFSVPANVHLVGTMNTADRSLAGLDIALRRRFTFKEMAPQPDLLRGVVVDGVDVGELLAVMNERIEVLLDRDHTLGHAYFMGLAEPGGNTLAALAQVFRGNVLPLLQEYFFEDWERIALVLNDLRKPVHRQFVHKPASNLDKLFGADHALKLSDRRWQIDEQAFGFIESYSGILS